MATQSFSSPCCEDTHSTPGQAPREDAFALVSYKEKRGQSWLQFSQARGRTWQKLPEQSPQGSAHSAHLTVPFRERNNTGWQTWGNLSWWHKKEPTFTCPCSGGCCQGVTAKSPAFHGCPTGVLPTRMCLEQDHLQQDHHCTCSGTFAQHAACCQLQFDL